ncbi:proline-specific peptidase [Nitzschia inconspicua]|uniref:Proline-specific peptidase n=1 Tax=Nitzschia inconspicua TaxID=303405 RepID=A0A9K3PJA5_9STRA|nr:proline-specific peptidase [Nitzschia inconspicua]
MSSSKVARILAFIVVFECLIGIVSTLTVQSSRLQETWSGWTCDELTPDLCDDLEVSSGTVAMEHGLYVKYWKYSSPSATNNRNTSGDSLLYPIIAVHGGPAFTHNYMLPLKQQACRGRDIYFYDQTGCGESKIPNANRTEDYPHLLDPQYYATIELPTLINYWGLHKYHVVGNSWGTILLQYFELNVRPTGLVSMTLSGPLSDGDLYIQSQWDAKVGNLGNLPPFVQKRIRHLEKTKQYESEEYNAINEALTGFFTVRTTPHPDCFQKSEEGVNAYIYVGMQGASEFAFGGVLAHFNTTPRLPTVRVPVLLTSGAFDTMRQPVVDAMYQTIPQVEWVVLNHSGHISMIDDAGWMNDVVEDFLNRVESVRVNTMEFSPNIEACGTPGCRSKYELRNDPTADTKILATRVGYSLWSLVASFFVGLGISWLGTTISVKYHQRKNQYELI